MGPNTPDQRGVKLAITITEELLSTQRLVKSPKQLLLGYGDWKVTEEVDKILKLLVDESLSAQLPERAIPVRTQQKMLEWSIKSGNEDLMKMVTQAVSHWQYRDMSCTHSLAELLNKYEEEEEEVGPDWGKWYVPQGL
jgi:hypothetical protein